MSLSLREQLLAAGLVTKKQVQKTELEQKQQQHGQKKKQLPPPPDKQAEARRAQAEKAARDAELNRQQREKAERKAKRAEIRQLVEQNRIPRIESDDFFNFVDANKIHRFAVTPEVREKILAGTLVVVRHNGFHALVPAEIADKVRERDPSFVVALDAPATAAPAEDDPYKDFVVPDDLRW
jgi:uncharacterized protein YaiL (DUF2058 family)